jgi:hypothetical protein
MRNKRQWINSPGSGQAAASPLPFADHSNIGLHTRTMPPTRGEKRAAERVLSRLQAGQHVSTSEMLKACPYRTVIDRAGASGGLNIDQAIRRIGCVIATVGGQPESLAEAEMAKALATLHSGRSVIVVSDRSDLRNRAKAEIYGMLTPSRGRA